MLGHQPDRLDHVVEHGLGDEVVEVDPDPARLDALAAVRDLALELVRPLQVDAEQPVPVRPPAARHRPGAVARVRARDRARLRGRASRAGSGSTSTTSSPRPFSTTWSRLSGAHQRRSQSQPPRAERQAPGRGKGWPDGSVQVPRSRKTSATIPSSARWTRRGSASSGRRLAIAGFLVGGPRRSRHGSISSCFAMATRSRSCSGQRSAGRGDLDGRSAPRDRHVEVAGSGSSRSQQDSCISSRPSTRRGDRHRASTCRRSRPPPPSSPGGRATNERFLVDWSATAQLGVPIMRGRGERSSRRRSPLWVAGIEAQARLPADIRPGRPGRRAPTTRGAARLPSPARRGDILDRRGRVLATSVDADTIYAVPTEIDNARRSGRRALPERSRTAMRRNAWRSPSGSGRSARLRK